MQTNADSESILPTFSCQIEVKVWVRAIKDGGCQSNLISEKLADRLNLKVVHDDLKLTVSGINVSQEYHTKVVELNVRFGGKYHKITAMCLPSININLQLPGLSKAVKKFVDKGFSCVINS